MLQITKNVYVETGMLACNVGCLVTKAGLVMIDTPMKPTDAAKWREATGKYGQSKYVINTEEHEDHWLGSHFFKGTLITSQNTRDKLTRKAAADVQKTVSRIDPQGMSLMKDYQVRLADITFTEGLTFYLGEYSIQLFALPGHSTGGIGVYIPEDKVVFTTDIVFHKRKSWLHESNPEAWLTSLKKLSDLNPEVVVPGHGAICKKDVFKEEASIVQNWIDAVKKAIKQGLTLEEAITRVTNPDPYPKQEGTPMTEPELNKAIITHLYQYYSR
jgi:cyclase